MNNEAYKLAQEVLTLNPTAGELGEGKARRLIELANRVLEETKENEGERQRQENLDH